MNAYLYFLAGEVALFLVLDIAVNREGETETVGGRPARHRPSPRGFAQNERGFVRGGEGWRCRRLVPVPVQPRLQ